jgi:thymidylate synthase (FAD)
MFLPPEDVKDARKDQLQGSGAAKLIEYAGRKCYDSLGSGRSSADYHNHLLSVKHGSVLEHAQYSFLISGVSRSLTHELVRHRVGVAISQRSTRYVDESTSKVVEHPLFEKFKTKEISDGVEFIGNASRVLYNIIYNAIYYGLVAYGTDKATAKKQARGAARQYLENGMETELVWSANVRALRHVINMRGSEHADAEIRLLAVELYNIMSKVLPEYFSDGEVIKTKDGIDGIRLRTV